MALTPTRRDLFAGRWSVPLGLVRPPWSRLDRFTRTCVDCNLCLTACPVDIVAKDTAGFPVMDFAKGECVFCGECAVSCPTGVFASPLDVPWAIKPLIDAKCLPVQGVVCQSCRDSCPTAAITFRPRLGAPAKPEINLDLCTGCGGCVAPCPAAAITMETGATV